MGPFVTPALFWGGSLLIAGPILIHLLNKRQFRVLDWAAMDFLFEANKSNRRRIRLEDLLLLLLRCLAVILIALLVARPFFQSRGLGDSLNAYSRLVVLDDSYSMTARNGGRSVLDQAKQLVSDLVGQWSTGQAAGGFRLVLTSDPTKPVIMAESLTKDNLGEVLDQIKALEPSSLPARLPHGLESLHNLLGEDSSNTLVYLLTDLRQRDWAAVGSQADNPSTAVTSSSSTRSAVESLQKLGDRVSGCYLIGMSDPKIANLAVASIRPQNPVLVSGVPVSFDVSITNHGSQPAANTVVAFGAQGSLPLTKTIDVIQAGETIVVQFEYTFAERDASQLVAVPVHVELKSAAGELVDAVEADSRRYFAARLSPGIQALVVDGDSSPLPQHSESVYLQKALDQKSSIVKVTVVEPSEFEVAHLDQYQVVFLCNVERLSEQRLESLEQWCRQGGGLVIAPGDQLFDPENFNQRLYRDGKGLSPVRLVELQGDERKSNWVHLNIEQSNHELLRFFYGQNRPLLSRAKIFRWWDSRLPDETSSRSVASVLARFTNPSKSIAIAEKRFGEGRVVAFLSPLDDDWNNFPKALGGGSYVVMMQDLIRYIARSTGNEGDLQIGMPLILPV
ncbi:MAG: BatA domain-containing protein, partial [Planctomycetales bacterium]